jgi:hypothetical protein
LKITGEKLQPWLKGTTYCDIGCGGGDLVAWLKNNNTQFSEHTGIDVLDWRTDNLKDEINFRMVDFSVAEQRNEKKYDTATCVAVLHHVGGTDLSLRTFLRNLNNAISRQGRLIIEEDVILPAHELESNNIYLDQARLRAEEQPYFSEYLAMNRDEQRAVLIIIDFLANTLIVGIKEMAHPFGFRSLNEWTKLFVSSGFRLEDLRINGFTEGLFNRSSHVLFILSPG